MKKFLPLLLKLTIATAALYYVVTNAETGGIAFYLKKINPPYLVAAFLLVNFATIISGLRLRVYLQSENKNVTKKEAIKLFYIGMFFNLFLPGGIGGDSYLAIKINRGKNLPLLEAIRLLLLARANGLFFLNIIFFALIWFSKFRFIFDKEQMVLVGLMILQIPVYYLVAGRFLKEGFQTFLAAGKFSLISQVLMVGAAICIFRGLGLSSNFVDYACLFVAASIASVIPITPAGVGVREFVFFEGAKLTGLNPEFGVANSLLFFGIYFLTALIGLLFYLRQK